MHAIVLSFLLMSSRARICERFVFLRANACSWFGRENSVTLGHLFSVHSNRNGDIFLHIYCAPYQSQTQLSQEATRKDCPTPLTRKRQILAPIRSNICSMPTACYWEPQLNYFHLALYILWYLRHTDKTQHESKVTANYTARFGKPCAASDALACDASSSQTTMQ